MLRFYYTRHDIPTMQTPYSSPFKLKSAAAYVGKILPLSHLYVTSNHYVDYLKTALGDEHQGKLEELDSQQQQLLVKHPGFPVDFKNRQFNSIRELRAAIVKVVGDTDTVNIVVINGIGNGLGDNYIGLGALQRLTNLLAPTRVQFHLMQELDQRIAPVYRHQSNVTMHCNVMPMSQFFKMDFHIDLDGLVNMPHFDHIPAAHFNAHAFSVNRLIPKTNLQAKITTDSVKTLKMRTIITREFDKKQKTVLLHPVSSSPLRTLPSQQSAQIVRALIAAGFTVVCAFRHDKPPNGFVDVSEHCNSIDDLTHIINAVDAVISVGTVVYHLSAALSKPTVLLPTVLPDIRSAQLLPQVRTWLPKNNQNFIQNLHKSDAPEHLAMAKKIWLNLDPEELAQETQRHIDSFHKTQSGHWHAPTAPKRVAVIVPNLGQLTVLTKCLDNLIKVQGFDPLRLYIVANNEHFCRNLYHSFQQALNDGYDFIWLLNENTQIAPDYLQVAFKQFQENSQLDIIGEHINSKEKNLLWGSVDESLNQASLKAWSRLSTSVLRASRKKIPDA